MVELVENPAQSPATATITVAIVEDDSRVRQSLAVLIDGSPGFSCAGTYEDAETALEKIPLAPPSVVLMDINLPNISGVECVQRLKFRCPDLNVIMLTVHEDEDVIFKALQAGANGYLLKRTPSSEILDAIAEVHKGGAPMTSSIARKVIQSFHPGRGNLPEGTGLTNREAEILQALAKGFMYKEIAAQLSVSFETIHSHVRSIYKKLQVRSRTQAVAKFLENKVR